MASSHKTFSASSSLPSPSSAIVLSPCAACKLLRRRCTDKCMLAPYFSPSDLQKFTNVHRIFGASNIIKVLQEIPLSQRADAVSSMAYEADARKKVDELRAQLARAQAEAVNAHAHNANLVALLRRRRTTCRYSATTTIVAASPPATTPLCFLDEEPSFFLDDDDACRGAAQGAAPLWT
ncbi:LOB domain-containing protein 1-like [Zingiber officinale]|uniref:LOB domain-containing protein 1-like n=1 Tax=Zingiber officinale TaxID=94328 RepID=UPI001C4C77A5|nr:LOB domain-containing protein 1-like [Zingiber officinale]